VADNSYFTYSSSTGPPTSDLRPSDRHFFIPDLPFQQWIGSISFSFSIHRNWKGKNMGARRIRREQRREDMAESRHRNGIEKSKERSRRDVRLLDAVKKGQLPYTPPILSWLSVRLNKPGRLITPEDVAALLKK
ncbi:MAG TPA: hypothetical protein VGY77_10100, partial [Gemmataceae bacterium]|nr:hypothetical protein [Gemmataceae bacterium]